MMIAAVTVPQPGWAISWGAWASIRLVCWGRAGRLDELASVVALVLDRVGDVLLIEGVMCW